MAEAFAKLPTQSAILDGELVLIERRGSAHFYRLMAQMRTSHPDESQLMFMAFDLLHQDGVDLRALALSERKRDLRRLCRKSRVPFMREVQTFPNVTLLFDHCSKFGFEGVVSKRLASRYAGGPSRNWVKTKCPGWKRINAERYRLFEGPPRKPELTEAQKTLAKKRQELARVLERLRSPQLSHGMARELRKKVVNLELKLPSWSKRGNPEKNPGWVRSASRFAHRAPRCAINQGCQVGSRAASDPASALCRTVTSWRHIRSSRRCDGEFRRQQRRGTIAARGATRRDVARRSASASVAVWPS